jgi:hypothetical protein
MKQTEKDQLRDIAREFGRLETRIRRAGLNGDTAKGARSRAEVKAFATALLAGDFGDLG